MCSTWNMLKLNYCLFFQTDCREKSEMKYYTKKSTRIFSAFFYFFPILEIFQPIVNRLTTTATSTNKSQYNNFHMLCPLSVYEYVLVWLIHSSNIQINKH